MSGAMSAFCDQVGQLAECFLRGKSFDAPTSHGDQATMRFPAPTHCGKDDTGIENNFHFLVFRRLRMLA